MTARRPAPRGELGDAVVAVARSQRAPSNHVADALDVAGADVKLLGISRTIADQLTSDPPDVVVIDHSNDDFNVSRLCASVHESVAAPILVYTTTIHTTDEEMVELLRCGASAVVASETSPARLLAQVGAILRLTGQRSRPATPLTVGDVTIDVENHRLMIGDLVVACSPLLRQLLAVLAESPDRAVSQGMLLARVWGLDASIRTQRVRFAIGSLRKLLGSGPLRPSIETVPMGYRLATPK